MMGTLIIFLLTVVQAIRVENQNVELERLYLLDVIRQKKVIEDRKEISANHLKHPPVDEDIMAKNPRAREVADEEEKFEAHLRQQYTDVKATTLLNGHQRLHSHFQQMGLVKLTYWSWNNAVVVLSWLVVLAFPIVLWASMRDTLKKKIQK